MIQNKDIIKVRMKIEFDTIGFTLASILACKSAAASYGLGALQQHNCIYRWGSSPHQFYPMKLLPCTHTRYTDTITNIIL